MTLLWLLACGPLPVDEPLDPLVQDTTPGPLDIPALWAGAFPSNTRITLPEAVVISPVTADGTTFYVQHPGGGPASGLQVKLGDGLSDWPPPVGSRVSLTGTTILFNGGPTLWLKDEDDLRLLPGTTEPVAVPFSDDPTLVWTLVHAEDVVVTSAVDPAGLADTSLGQRLRPEFGTPTPGWNRTGDLVAINALASGLLLRSEADWSGDFEGDPPIDAVIGTGQLIALADGTPVTIPDLAQATPWSTGDRYALLQDADGDGLWVDTEGFGTLGSEAGTVGTWTGEIRYGGDGFRLRAYTPVLVDDTQTRGPVIYGGPVENTPAASLVFQTVTDLTPTGPRGDRSSAVWLLDNRFVDLDALTDPDDVYGAVRVDGEGVWRLAVLAY